MEHSLIFTVVSLSSFFGEHFPAISWYPYWYLGNPYSYLIGPVVPVVLVFLVKTFQLSFYHAYVVLIVACLVSSAMGTYLFIRAWGNRHIHALVSSVLALFLPFNLFLLQSQNGLKHVVFGFLPFVLLLYLWYLRTGKGKFGFLIILGVTLVLLTNTASLLAVAIGFVAIFIAEAKKNKRFTVDMIEYFVGKTLLLLAISLCLSTLWYTPLYWWVVLANPSFGGVPFFRLVLNIFNALLSFLPIVLALLVVKWRHSKIQGYNLFCVLFFASFLLLTIFRFAADPDFVMDWMGFGLELQWAVALLLGSLVVKLGQKKVFIKVGFAVLFTFLVVLWGMQLKDVFKYTQNEYKQDISGLIDSQDIKKKRAFLSGSAVFWINNITPLSQVRGGNDSVSIHPYWADGAYQIREGEEKELTDYWLKILGASYVLVHTAESQEPFHDFKHPEKFEAYKELVEEHGNVLYQIPDNSIARIADKSLLQVMPPTNGADEKALSGYIVALKKPLIMEQKNPSTLLLSANLKKDEVVSIAMTYDTSWNITEGKGLLVRDTFGNTVIIPDNSGEQLFVLEYKKSLVGFFVTLFVGLLLFVVMFNYEQVVPRLRKRLPNFSMGIHDEDKDY